jgi:hypothetical protein
MSVLFFIDANGYLSLYGLGGRAKNLLDVLEEQKDNIFLSTQIVHEVNRNKLNCVRVAFDGAIKGVGDLNSAMPNHIHQLLGITERKAKELRDTFTKAKKARDEISTQVAGALEKISRSTDEISQRLKPLFSKAVAATGEELSRARECKERGNPPGKPGDPLGDQLTWEQLLSYCMEKKVTRLWIASNDGDYCTKFGGSFFLNSSLYQDLLNACGAGLEVRCFGDAPDAANDFTKNAGVKAEKLLSNEDVEQMKKAILEINPEAVRRLMALTPLWTGPTLDFDIVPMRFNLNPATGNAALDASTFRIPSFKSAERDSQITDLPSAKPKE